MITRRDRLRSVAGKVGLLGWPPGHASGEPPPETTTLRIAQQPSVCVAPQFIVTDLLKAEGFTDVKYVKVTIAGISKALMSPFTSSRRWSPQLDAGDPITVLGGVHVGCFELLGTDRSRDPGSEGKTVAITELWLGHNLRRASRHQGQAAACERKR
jgi:NitT/TauT family transport system substrate-binding protein